MAAIPIGMRLEEKELKEIEHVSRLEHVDRTTAIRKMIHLGLHQYLMEKAAEKLVRGEYSLGRAAEEAQTSIFEMQEFLIAKGYRHYETREELTQGIETARKILRGK